MTYYQFTTNRAGKTSPFDKKCCANRPSALIRGELFVSFKDGDILAVDALYCPTCSAVFSERMFLPEDQRVENAHFLGADSKD